MVHLLSCNVLPHVHFTLSISCLLLCCHSMSAALGPFAVLLVMSCIISVSLCPSAVCWVVVCCHSMSAAQYVCCTRFICYLTGTVNSLLTDTRVSRQLTTYRHFSHFLLLPHSQTLYLHIPVSGRRHFWKWNWDFFIRSLPSGHPTFSPLYIFTNENCLYFKRQPTKVWPSTEQQISGDRFSQAVRSFDMTSSKSFSCYIWPPTKT